MQPHRSGFRRVLFVALPVLAALGLGGASTEPAQADTPEAQRPSGAGDADSEVAAFLRHYLELLETRDEARVRELYCADERFAWFTDGTLSYATVDELLAGLRGFGEIRFDTTASEVRVIALSTEHAAASFAFQTRLTIPGAADHVYAGVITLLLEREGGGTPWRVLQGHTSTPGGPPRRSGGSR